MTTQDHLMFADWAVNGAPAGVAEGNVERGCFVFSVVHIPDIYIELL